MRHICIEESVHCLHSVTADGTFVVIKGFQELCIRTPAAHTAIIVQVHTASPVVKTNDCQFNETFVITLAQGKAIRAAERMYCWSSNLHGEMKTKQRNITAVNSCVSALQAARYGSTASPDMELRPQAAAGHSTDLYVRPGQLHHMLFLHCACAIIT